MPNLRDDIANAVKNVKVGGVSEPLRSNDGYQIFRVDERTPASTRQLSTRTRCARRSRWSAAPKAREEYLQSCATKPTSRFPRATAPRWRRLLKLTPEKTADNSDGSTAKSPEKKKGKTARHLPETVRNSRQDAGAEARAETTRAYLQLLIPADLLL